MKKQKVMSLLASIIVLVALVWMTGCGGTPSTAVSDTTTSTLGLSDETTDITSPTIWTSDKVHVVTRGIAVNAALTIQPGTIIKFKPGAGITVNSAGTINADAGSAATPIIFTSMRDDAHGGDSNVDGNLTSPAAKDWSGIGIWSNGSKFNFCEFYYGGGGTYLITLDLATSDNVKVTNCTFAHNDGGTLSGGYGTLWTGSAKSGTVVTGNIFYDNNVPLSISTAHNLDNTNIFHNPINPLEKNTYNGIFMAPGGNSTNHVAGNITWSNTEVPYVINKDNVIVDIGASLTLADNVVVKLAGHGIEVWGTLNANAANKNVFTSLKDDTVGGDTNGDGTATQAAMGDWAKLVITDGGTAAFNHCQFLYGGAGTYQITLDLTTSNNVKVTNCMFAHNDGGTLSGGYGALWTGSAKSGTVVTGNIFYANNVPLSISTAHSLDNTNIFHNPVNPLEKNTYNGIFMAPGGNSTNHVTGNITWSNTEVPYVINKDSVVIDIGATLTLADNVVVKSFGHEVDVWGNLNQGVGNVFTSLYDDTVMGDTNGDGTANVPVVGNWTGIWFNSGAPAPTWVNTQWANWLNMHYEASH